jgi:glycine reductase complex component B subunit gamma
MNPVRVLHYLNQFFAGLGGEGDAGLAPRLEPLPIGPGLLLEQSLGGQGKVVGTLVCGDDRFHREPEACIDALARLGVTCAANVLVTGPAFDAGRYGIACGRVAAELGARLRIPSVTAMFPHNPAVPLHRGETYILPTAGTAAGMADALARLAVFAMRLAARDSIGPAAEEGYLPRGRRLNVLRPRSAAERVVDALVLKLRGAPGAGEIPVPDEEPVRPAAPVGRAAAARIALITEGGIVPRGNPDRLESRRATSWRRYPLPDRLSRERYDCVHAGFDTRWVVDDPNRVLPLDAAREIERAGGIGALHDHYYVTVGVGTTAEHARRFGREIAEELTRDGVAAAVMTAT